MDESPCRDCKRAEKNLPHRHKNGCVTIENAQTLAAKGGQVPGTYGESPTIKPIRTSVIRGRQ